MCKPRSWFSIVKFYPRCNFFPNISIPLAEASKSKILTELYVRNYLDASRSVCSDAENFELRNATRTESGKGILESFMPRIRRKSFVNSFRNFRLSKSQQHLSDSFEVSNPRVSRSRFTSDTYSVSDPHVSLPNFVQQSSRHHKPDQLNILEWPEAPKRYQSVQNLDNVSGLVDVVEENWPSEGNRSIDCIYTQVICFDSLIPPSIFHDFTTTLAVSGKTKTEGAQKSGQRSFRGR